MKYKVISYFEDLQDNKHSYNKGDTYPRKGLKPSEERIAELMSADNKQRKPLIEEKVESYVNDDTEEIGGYDD